MQCVLYAMCLSQGAAIRWGGCMQCVLVRVLPSGGAGCCRQGGGGGGGGGGPVCNVS